MSVSLIIPVYNVEKYLDKCLGSVEKQTFKDFEAVIVNDGSTDNSLEIIEKYTQRNDNFICFSTENNGLGGARNFGLSKAAGEYVVFLDSDDYISPDCLEKLYRAITDNESDIAVCNIYDVKEDGTVISTSKTNLCNVTTSLFESHQILFNRPCAWAKMYRKSLFDGFSYVSREWYEDIRLTPKLFLKANKITYIDDYLFFYVQRAGSIMNNSNAKRNLEIINAFDDLISYFKESGAYETYQSELEYLVVEHIAVSGLTRVVLSKDKNKKAVLKKMEEYISGFENLYSNKYIGNLDKNKRLILFFNKNKLYFLTSLCMNGKRLLGK